MSCQGLYQPQGWCLCVLSDPQTSVSGAVRDVLGPPQSTRGATKQHWGATKQRCVHGLCCPVLPGKSSHHQPAPPGFLVAKCHL